MIGGRRYAGGVGGEGTKVVVEKVRPDDFSAGDGREEGGGEGKAGRESMTSLFLRWR